MLRKRFLVLLGACFLMGSAAWADDVGYVDCTSHPDASPIFAKARKTPDTVATVACGERFTVLVYGFIFSRVQTGGGQVGYIYSSLISVDRSATSVQRSASARASAAPSPAAAAPVVTTSAPQAQAPITQTTPPPQAAQSDPVTFSQPKPAAAQPASAPVATAAPVSAPAPQPVYTAPEPAPAAPQPSPAAPSQPAPSLPTAAQVEAAVSAPAAQPASSSADPTPAPPAEQPASSSTSASAYQPEAAPAQPAVRNASVRSSTWEKPLPGAGTRRNFLVELFGGVSYAGLNSNGTMTNFLGGMGSFGYNMTSWLQIVGDSSYNTVTVSGTKNVLYGNHFGPRFYYRRFNRWGMTPFAEALVGGSRLDATYNGTKTSANCISYKAGGGVDVRIKRHWEVRLIDVDYYRTSFGTNQTQNYYSASAGVILRLFGTGTGE
jgi:hypothetical protein